MSASLRSRLRRWLHKSKTSSQPVRNVSLHLETLETRALPSAKLLALPAAMPAMSRAQPSLEQTFIATVYQGELQRPADNAGLIYWRDVLNQTGSRAQTVDGILNSNEYLNLEIWKDYGSLLGRAPDPSGWSNFMQALQHGATPQNVKAGILGSDEFFSCVGDNSGSFLDALYSEELGRSVDAQGLAHWTPLTGNAAGRAEIARQVEASPEATHLFVSTAYQDILGRSPDAGGLAYWSRQLQQGGSQTTVLAGVLGSDEFFQRMEVYVAGLNTNDPNVAAAQFIAADHLFGSQPAVVPPRQPVVVVTGGDTSAPMDAPPIDLVTNPVVDNPVMATPIVDISVVDNPVVDNPVVDNSCDNNPVFDNSCDTNPVIDNSCDTNPVIDNSGDTNPVIDNSGDTNPVIDNSGDNSVVDANTYTPPSDPSSYQSPDYSLNAVVDASPVVDNSAVDTTSYAPQTDTSNSSQDYTYTAYSVDPGTQDTSGYGVDSNFVDASFDPSASW